MKTGESEPLHRLTVSVPASVAEAYRRAAKELGKSVSEVLRDVLEDGVRGTQAAVEVARHMAAGDTLAATEAYFRLARTMEAEAMAAMVDANVRLLDLRAYGLRAAIPSAANPAEIWRQHPGLLPILDALWAYRLEKEIVSRCSLCHEPLELAVDRYDKVRVWCRTGCTEMIIDQVGWEVYWRLDDVSQSVDYRPVARAEGHFPPPTDPPAHS